ncbi:MAG TPA: peptidoglycan-associated lipoprotein Pal, partial [Burkholderiales bacterium]|nr:peptidoglycan-associated lipoprotein Pal [Burkholderiales bacterium]
VLAACSTAPTKDQEGAAVEERGDKPQVVDRTPVKPAEGTAKPFKDRPLSGNPLTDPNNILSRRSILFDYDSFIVKDEYKAMVTAHARYLQKNPSARMRVEGHADERGSREYNLALGQRRAEAVKQMLQLLGARPDQIESVSLGEEKPRCSDSTESCWAQNRRGDIAYPDE